MKHPFSNFFFNAKIFELPFNPTKLTTGSTSLLLISLSFEMSSIHLSSLPSNFYSNKFHYFNFLCKQRTKDL